MTRRARRQGVRGAVSIFVFASASAADGDLTFAAAQQGDETASLVVQTISGYVRDDIGPIAGAVVRIQTTNVMTTTDADGRFSIPLRFGSWSADRAFESTSQGILTRTTPLTASATGYYNAGPVLVRASDHDIVFMLKPHTRADNPQYIWVPAATGDGSGLCQNCHSDPDNPDSSLAYDEWTRDAHSRSNTNPVFVSMYNGTDLSGHQSPRTRTAVQRDYGRVPLPPDESQPYFGPGFKLDFPDQVGNCAACHAPAAATNQPTTTDPLDVIGAGDEGVTCDLCHKVWDVRLNPETGLPMENMPGVMSMEFRRPGDERQLFLGPLDDVAPGDDATSDVFRESRYCAPCHYASFWGVEVYGSYREWLDSNYSDPQSGRTCQDCHMPIRGVTHFARADRGGLARDPKTIASHLMPSASDSSFLRDAVTLDVAASRGDGFIDVIASVVNVGAGHHIPTDSPLRNMILVVSVRDVTGEDSSLQIGPSLPDWAGDFAGRPGRGFAKALEELWTEVSPSGAYWNPIRLVSDTRIPANATDRSQYRFSAQGGAVVVTARLIYRRVFQKLAHQKRLNLTDILLHEVRIEVP